jgi:hypothetical protein
MPAGGGFTGKACLDFTTPAADPNIAAAVGATNQTDARWTAIYDQFCDRTAHLYCFEQ